MLGKTITNRKTVRIGAQMVAEEVRSKEFEFRSLGRLKKIKTHKADAGSIQIRTSSGNLGIEHARVFKTRRSF